MHKKRLVNANKKNIIDLSNRLRELQSQAIIKLRFIVINQAAESQIQKLMAMMRSLQAQAGQLGANLPGVSGASIGDVEGPQPFSPVPTNFIPPGILTGPAALTANNLNSGATTGGGSSSSVMNQTNNFDINTILSRSEVRKLMDMIVAKLKKSFDSQRSTGSARTFPGSGNPTSNSGPSTAGGK